MMVTGLDPRALAIPESLTDRKGDANTVLPTFVTSCWSPSTLSSLSEPAELCHSPGHLSERGKSRLLALDE